MSSHLLSIVVPVYNEDKTIVDFLEGIERNCREPHEILIIYDFEGDSTLKRIASMERVPKSVRLVPNHFGKGVLNAIRTGFAECHGDVIVGMSADLADDPTVLPVMVKRIRDGADIVVASRYMAGGKEIGKTFLKRTLSKAAGLSLHALIGLPVHDATNYFRAYSCRVIDIPIESTKGFGFGLELLLKAFWNRWHIEEIPVIWHERVAGTSRFRLLRWLPEYLYWYVLAVHKHMTRQS